MKGGREPAESERRAFQAEGPAVHRPEMGTALVRSFRVKVGCLLEVGMTWASSRDRKKARRGECRRRNTCGKRGLEG